WLDKLELLILDNELRRKLHKNAKEDVLANYLLKDRVKKWDYILSNI
ncbi:MAG: glycosyltransferase family 1 protein, partial [Methanobrevibacter sp.]|nr:glycosyltransferase family 1 protein [Methanobrevibacter sp.]